MANLIITAPTVSWFEFVSGVGIPIFVDGRRVASIMPWKKRSSANSHPVTIRSRPGLRAGRVDRWKSKPPKKRRTGSLSPSARWRKLAGLSLILAMLSVLPFLVTALSISLLAAPGRLGLGLDLYTVFFLPTAVLRLAAPLAPLYVMLITRNDALALVKVPDLASTERQIAALLLSQRYRLRITTRDLMIAVAILALLFAGAIGWIRHQRSINSGDTRRCMTKSRRSRAMPSADFSDSERTRKSEARMGAAQRQYVAKWRTQADYHAAMKRKYEQAAALARSSLNPTRLLRRDRDPRPGTGHRYHGGWRSSVKQNVCNISSPMVAIALSGIALAMVRWCSVNTANHAVLFSLGPLCGVYLQTRGRCSHEC